MKSLYYILFFVIFSSVYYFVICQNVPSPRIQQTSTLVGTRLYFFGGATSLNVFSEVWYLDLSNSFETSTSPWHSDVAMPVGYNFGTSSLSPIDNSTVFLIGGMTWTKDTNNYLYTSSVYKFNSKNSQWTIPSINNFNSSFATRYATQAVVSNNGAIFVFGGSNYTINDNIINTIFDDMNILDINTMIWSTQTQYRPEFLNGFDYTATLLPSGLIVYIGGGGTSFNNLSQIQIFNTNLIPGKLNPIIIYGGAGYNSSGSIGNVFSDLAVLDTNSWLWTVPSVSGTRAPPPLSMHSAALYKNYMIIAFGATSSTSLSNNCYILDIQNQNYTWVTKFNVLTTTNPVIQTHNNGNSSTEQANNNSSNLYFGIGIGAGVVSLAIVLFIIGFFIYKNQHKEKFIATPGTFKDDRIR
ncbi:galactose oxidase [Gigaspora margarita]|uniref:Galactose oxidase n=1 Tax=Gigaspora margarita TaxID=4874 RepID=A0A8H3X2I2_GIGMA|nr:galactose oxidase [Gigaspora margarita]